MWVGPMRRAFFSRLSCIATVIMDGQQDSATEEGFVSLCRYFFLLLPFAQISFAFFIFSRSWGGLALQGESQGGTGPGVVPCAVAAESPFWQKY